jgi:hypothetical protein
MAKDLMRMLTEITPTQQPTSAVPGTPGFRGMFGQQQAQRLQGSLGSLARGGVPSPQARMGQALAGLDLNKPEDLAKLAKIQQGTGDFAGAAKTAAKIKALRSEEAQVTSSTALKQATKLAVAEKYGEERTDLLALVDQGLPLKDIDAFAVKPDTEERFKISGKNVFDTKTQKFLAPPPNAEGKAYRVQKFYDPEQKRNVVQWVAEDNANLVYREELEAVDTREESATFQKLVDKASDASYKAGVEANKAIAVAQEFDKYAGQITSGAIANVEELYKGVTGTQDKISLLRLSFNQLRLGRAIKNLPQGPATDKDIALVLEGELANNADPATVAQYARGLAKLARREQAYYDKQSAWYAIHGTPTGFPLQIQKDAIEETFAAIPEKDLAFIESDPSESNLAYFNATYGIDYLGLKNKLALAEKGLSNFGGGL